MRKHSIGICLVCTLLVLMNCAPVSAFADDPYAVLVIGSTDHKLLFSEAGSTFDLSSAGVPGTSGTATASIENGTKVLTLTDAKWAATGGQPPLKLNAVPVLRLVGNNDITYSNETYNGLILLYQFELTIEGTGTLTTHGVSPFLGRTLSMRGGATLIVDVNTGLMPPYLPELTLDNATIRYTDLTSNEFQVDTLTLLGGSSLTMNRPNADYGIWIDAAATVTDSTLEATGKHAGIYARNGFTITHLNSDNYVRGTSSMDTDNDYGGLVIAGFNQDPTISMGNAELIIPENGTLRRSLIAVLPTSPPILARVRRAADAYHILSFSANGDRNAKVVQLAMPGPTPTPEPNPTPGPQAVPKTGDSTSIALWITLLAITGIALATGFVKRSKE